MKWMIAVLPLFFVSCKKETLASGAARQEPIEPQREYLVGTNFKYDLSKRLGERMEDHKGIKSLLQRAGLELGEGTGVTWTGSFLYMTATAEDHRKMRELLAASPAKGLGRWLPVNTSGIAFSKIIYHEHETWQVGDHRMEDVSEVIQSVVSSDEPVMIVIGKASSLGDEELLSLAVKLSENGKRRVFYRQAKGNIDSIEDSFEFTR